MHLRFLQPMAPGIKEIMERFGQVHDDRGQLVAIDPEDEIIDESNRRYSALAMLLRARYLVDVDCWSEVRGQPIKPATDLRTPFASKLKRMRGTTHDPR